MLWKRVRQNCLFTIKQKFIKKKLTYLSTYNKIQSTAGSVNRKLVKTVAVQLCNSASNMFVNDRYLNLLKSQFILGKSTRRVCCKRRVLEGQSFFSFLNY